MRCFVEPANAFVLHYIISCGMVDFTIGSFLGYRNFMMRQSRRNKNISECDGWSFSFREESRYVNRWVAVAGDTITISGDIENDGLKLGTVYVRAQITRSHLAPSSYFDGSAIFDTHRDLDLGARSGHRVVDIEVGYRSPWSVYWLIPHGLMPGHFDFQIEIWNPPKLFDTPGPYLFHRTISFGGFEVLDPMDFSTGLQCFVSYSHDSLEHLRWVMRLGDELLRHGIISILDNKNVNIGDLFDDFMIKGIAGSSVFLPICSERYSSNAYNYTDGVGFEMQAIENILRTSPDSIRVIPIVRNNPTNRLPVAFRNIKSVDMRGADWQYQPLQELVRTIKS